MAPAQAPGITKRVEAQRGPLIIGPRYARWPGFPLQVQVGDVVVLRTTDASCRETWDREKFYWNGVRAMRVNAASNPWELPCGNILALVSRDGVEVNDSPEPR